jgi:hypothetical protein
VRCLLYEGMNHQESSAVVLLFMVAPPHAGLI